MVKAYRDTWNLGVHSYLAYLRDRLIVARELLADTGSIFVQIGDENVHRVRGLLDEVFGRENFIAADHAPKDNQRDEPISTRRCRLHPVVRAGTVSRRPTIRCISTKQNVALSTTEWSNYRTGRGDRCPTEERSMASSQNRRFRRRPPVSQYWTRERGRRCVLVSCRDRREEVPTEPEEPMENQ